MGDTMFGDLASVRQGLRDAGYLADDGIASVVFLAEKLGKPVLVEGPAGTGKTALGQSVAAMTGARLIRLQCYEGLDASSTLYEWNYVRQILQIRLAEADASRREGLEDSIFGEAFLFDRPLLQAIRHSGPRPAVLLIDEIDRADEEFEAFLLEILSDFQVTIPELGTFTAEEPPCVILTSNRTRELNDALKRRCLYLWIDYPSPEKEREIILRRVPGIEADLARAVATVIGGLRTVDFYKRPGVAESLDWARALLGLDITEIVPDLVRETAGVVLKYHDDVLRLDKLDLDALIAGRRVEMQD